MQDKKLMDQIRHLRLKRGYTLHELSRRLDVQIGTLERWLKTNRINRVYAEWIRKKLELF